MKIKYILVKDLLQYLSYMKVKLKAIFVRVYINSDDMRVYANKSLGCRRFIYNECLRYVKNLQKQRTEYLNSLYENYLYYGESMPSWMAFDKTDEYVSFSANDLDKHIQNLKSQESYSWIKDTNSKVVQQARKDFLTAYDRFLKGVSKFPQFKKKNEHEDSCRFISQCIQGGQSDTGCSCVTGNRISINKQFNNIVFKCSRCDEKYLNQFQSEIRSITLSRTKRNRYYMSILISDLDSKYLEEVEAIIGLDMGIKDFCIDSEGIKYENLHWLKNAEKRLKRFQRKFDKATGEKNKEKWRLKIANISNDIHNKRHDHHCKLAEQLARKYQIICIETLNIKGMVKNHNLAKSINECAWYDFIQVLERCCEKYGRTLVKIDQWFPSSKKCNRCGYKNTNLKLSDREWVCPVCGKRIDRDVNAAINIRNKGIETILQNISSYNFSEKLVASLKARMDECPKLTA